MSKKHWNWLIPLFAIAFTFCVDAADIRQRKYGQHTTIDFELYEADGIDMRVTAVDDGDECSIRKDGGAETTCTNDFVDEGVTYSLLLTSAEMTAERIILDIIDDTGTKIWLDRCIIIETYGHASAEHDPNTVASVFTDALDAAAIEAEAVDALESFDLDHWMKVTTAVAAGGDLSSFVHNLSVLGHILSNANVSDYGSDDDSLVILSDNQATIIADTDDIGVAGVGLTESGGTGDQLTAITAGVDVISFNDVATQMEMLMDVTTTVAADDDLEAVVVAGSVLAHVMGSGADVSTFDASTDALDNPSATVDEILDEPIADHLTWGTVGWFINLIRAIR